MMSDRDHFASIADASKPQAGRIYDFLLGGNHNFEVDRLAAQQLMQMVPVVPKVARIIRWFLGEAVRRLAEEGYRHFLDFASGLPTVDHIHQVAPAGTKVIYSDIDPVTVAYGQEILKDNPDVRFVQCNAGTPENLLNSPTLANLFGSTRKVAIGLSGIAYFLTDEQLSHSMKTLHDWAAKGSKLFLSDADAVGMTPEAESLMAWYKKLGEPLYRRSKEQFMKLAGPWKVQEPGFKPVEEWISMKKSVDTEMIRTFSSGMYGVILTK